jgi:RND family efflux transporter MFP subunit
MQPNHSSSLATVPVSRTSGTRAIRWFLAVPLLLAICGAIMIRIRWTEGQVLAAGAKFGDAEAVTVIHPTRAASDGDLSLPSTLQAYADAPIYARTSGYVTHWYANLGARVQQGQVLAVIDSPEIDQELDQARAVASQTQANLTLATITARRYQSLIDSKSVAQQDVDTNNQNLEGQKAGLEAAKANVKRLEQLQGFEQVTAPFDGVITQRITNIGDLVNAGNSGEGAQLFHISKVQTMRIFVPVPEIYSDQIKDGLTAELELNELPGQKFTGTVTRSSHAIDSGSHTLLTEIDIVNPNDRLMPGAYANVHIHLAPQASELTVPTGAVLFQAAGPQVAVVNSKNEIELRRVGVGRDFGNNIEITSGLAITDQIVSSPPDYLINGMVVTIQSSDRQNN